MAVGEAHLPGVVAPTADAEDHSSPREARVRGRGGVVVLAREQWVGRERELEDGEQRRRDGQIQEDLRLHAAQI